MKKFIYILTILIASIGIASCNNDDDGSDGPEEGWIWDIYHTGVRIYLVDENGNNLLDPEIEGNWVGEEMMVTYADTPYYTNWTNYAPPTETRSVGPAYLNGLTWEGNRYGIESKYNHLYFGEFEGTEDHDISLSFSITGLKRTYDIRFTHHFYWKNHKPDRDQHIICEGKDIEGNRLELIIPHNPSH